MADEEIDRKIAVIFATDVVGYSKHMESNEKETIKSLKICEKILRNLFKKHKGRLFATGGEVRETIFSHSYVKWHRNYLQRKHADKHKFKGHQKKIPLHYRA